MTGIQPYGAFVETPDHTEGLIHISEIMDDYVHNLKKFLSEGQVVKAKILSIDDEGKFLSLKIMITLKIMSVKRKQSVLDEIRETEKYGFQTLKERLPVWIKHPQRTIKSKRRIVPTCDAVIYAINYMITTILNKQCC